MSLRLIDTDMWEDMLVVPHNLRSEDGAGRNVFQSVWVHQPRRSCGVHDYHWKMI